MEKFVLAPSEKEELNCIVVILSAGDSNNVLFQLNTSSSVLNCKRFDSWLPYHLYQISKENLKVNDWCYDSLLGIVFQLDDTSNMEYVNKSEYIYKVIATTDRYISPKIHTGEIIDESYPEEFRNGIVNISTEQVDTFIKNNKERIYNNIKSKDVEIENFKNSISLSRFIQFNCL